MTASGTITIWLGIVLFIGVIVGIWLVSHYGNLSGQYRRLDFSDRANRYQLTQELLKLLQKDIHPQDRIALSLNLLDPYLSEKLMRTSPNLRRSGRNFYFYDDLFLVILGRFCDGVIFLLQVVHHHRACRWRNENGRSREKLKDKGYTVRLSLSYPESLQPYLEQSRPTQPEQGVKLPSQLSLSFPRSAWERSPDALRRVPCAPPGRRASARHSHAERGND